MPEKQLIVVVATATVVVTGRNIQSSQH